MPRPQPYTELYFTDRPKQSNPAIVGTEQKLPFIIHNHEHRTTTYHYKLMAASADGSVERQMSEGSITLTHDHTQIIDSTMALPSLGKRVTLKVILSYNAVSAGDGKVSSQKQSIHYWLDTANPRSNNRNGHASS